METETNQGQLSAEAAEFVPTQDAGALPTYMFNCYPFVTDPYIHKAGLKHQYGGSAGATHNVHAAHQGAMRKHAAGAPLTPRMPYNPGCYSHMTPPRLGMYHGPGGYYGPPHCASSPAIPGYAYPPYNGNMPLSLHNMNSHRVRGPRPATHPINNNNTMQQQTKSTVNNSSWPGAPHHRKHQRQGSANDRRPKISVGTQNEFGSKGSNSNKPASNPRSVTRTIILVDTAAQTDFSSEIADHTLEQMPNALYQGKRKVRRKTLPTRQAQTGGGDSTDSEELDHSDSGYSSPMHRQNQISSGTDAQAKALSSESQPSTVPPETLDHARVSTRTGHCPAQAVLSQTSNAVRPASSVYHSSPNYEQHEHLAMHSPNTSVLMSYASAVSTCRQPISMQYSLQSSTEGDQQTTPHKDGAISEPDDEMDESSGGKKKKRKRGRRRRRKDKGQLDETKISGDIADDSQYISVNREECSSPILSQETPFNLLAPERMSEDFPSFAEAGLYDDSVECKLSGKRKKRREQANKAAIEEQLEIDLEQQALKVVNQTPVIVKPTPLNAAAGPPSAKKSQQPVSINIMDFITNAKPTSKGLQSDNDSHVSTTKKTSASPKSALNPLDSTAPILKRGKERETPKAKKPSALKKVILKEREERKRLRYIGDGPVDLISTPDSSLHFTSEPEEGDEDDDVISDMEDPHSLGNSLGDCELSAPHSQDLSPVSQNSPISVGLMSPPTSLSNAASGVGSPTVVSDIIQKIHSRRFREYCNQVLDKEIDTNCTNLLQTLVKFQDRLYHKDPIKAKTKRRLVLGLREVTKHLKLRRVKLVIISPNLEKIQSKGGLDDALNMIINLCSEQDVPFVFALGRRSLGRACAKLVPVSVVGVFNYQGAETMYNELIDLTSQAREAYHEMVDALAKEVAEYGGHLKGSCGLYFSHLGHSRTPSGCSAISFTSSILSEPVPEVKQQEHSNSNSSSIVVNSSVVVNSSAVVNSGPVYCKPATNNNNNTNSGTPSEQTSSQSSVPTSASSSVNENRGPLQDDIYDIDEGNEADTEDNDMSNHSPTTQQPPELIVNNKSGETTANTTMTNNTTDINNSNNLNESKTYFNNNDKNGEIIPLYQEKTNGMSTVETISQSLSQISLKKRSHDSHRRTNSGGSHFEVRSQTSSRTLDQHDTVSTHSSVTIENASESEHISDPLGSSSSSCRLDRIKSWVRDVDSTSTPPTDISQDDVEFNATYTACEANTDVLISRSRSPSVSKS